uniref:Uncharacterized protein n=1 Tax=Aegilops tauschii subsp. strangulata TaxID=200361 RepID=A0A453SRX3_AEGTS
MHVWLCPPTGRMMHIMSDYYGIELIVPYGTKHISNLKSELNKDATKEGDMIETVAYFKDQQKKIQISFTR